MDVKRKCMKKIEMIASLIDSNSIVCDIGCDHGYLLKYAILNKNIKYGIAVDNKEGPLNNAKTNLSNNTNVKFILSDGLCNVDEEIDIAVIAGMGGILIKSIIERSILKFGKIKKIILSPNRNSDQLRKFMNDNGFKIIDERIVKEEDKFYEIIVYQEGFEVLTQKDYLFGPILLKNKDDLFIEKWTTKKNQIKNISRLLKEYELIDEVLK